MSLSHLCGVLCRSTTAENRRKSQIHREDCEGTVPTEVRTQTLRDLLRDNDSLPPRPKYLKNGSETPATLQIFRTAFVWEWH